MGGSFSAAIHGIFCNCFINSSFVLDKAPLKFIYLEFKFLGSYHEKFNFYIFTHLAEPKIALFIKF